MVVIPSMIQISAWLFTVNLGRPEFRDEDLRERGVAPLLEIPQLDVLLLGDHAGSMSESASWVNRVTGPPVAGIFTNASCIRSAASAAIASPDRTACIALFMSCVTTMLVI